MAQLTINTRLDADLKERFNAGEMESSVVDQIIRETGAMTSDENLDDDLKPLYAVESRHSGYKRLAGLLQALRIVEAAKKAATQPVVAADEEPKIVAASGPPGVTAAIEPAAPVTNG